MTAEQLKELEDNLWKAADKLRADSGLKASEYSTPILGLIFLRFASIRYNKVKAEIKAELEAQKKSRNQLKEEEIAILKCGFYLPLEAEYDYLLNLPEKTDIAKAIKKAMELIEYYKPELKDSLPKDEYFKLYTKDDRSLPKSLLKTFKDIPEDATGDVFGKVYEYFLGEFALAEGQGGGAFYTPTSVVKLMVEVIEPYKGTIYDPACGSGGMFVQSSEFVDKRRKELHDDDTKDLMVYGSEKDSETVKLARMNLAVNGLRGQVVQANAYYENPFDSYNKFDYVMANPPFNVDDVNYDRVKDDKRFNEYGIPKNKTKANAKKQAAVNSVPNANYLWINLFATSLKDTGRAALVMANSASDARNSEADIRQTLIKSGVIDCMLTLPKNMFYTVTLPATLWFFDKNKKQNKGKILFIDARNIFRQVTRALREFTDEHIQNIATIVRLYRGETKRLKQLLAKYQQQANDFEKQAKEQQQEVEKIKKAKPKEEKEIKRWEKQLEEAEKKWKALTEKQNYYLGHINWLNERFPNGVYEDVTGLCKAATLKEIEEQDYSLNPGRYVGVVIEEDGLTEEEFLAEMKERHISLNALNSKAKELEELITDNLKSIA
ncbi:MAG: N-6 DNA methylase [Sphingobacteriales bacterium]|jgi:type I restriction enzyme M protein|nr:N-6 DNA methylase [Sphingobacteriales bacterium]MBP9141501.1 N-6 DNA methylase [Chitinophagales bacterium]MDA0199228.1 class I SAM-dependent DNA methyltransferase [Bacteroidota bacterium]MBK6889187.1 N-6 DNA methylase [Sphingobacteriales bacterium]MBK7528309.1 N-6 DNA methylase [Sphingobacteriales bacterium]